MNRLITTNEIKAVIKKLPANDTPGLMALRVNSTNIQRTTTYTSQTIPKNSRGEKTPKLIL